MPTDEKLPDDIAALLREARTEGPPAGAKERVWSSTMARIDAPPPTPGLSRSAPASAVRTAALTGFAAGVLYGIAGTWVAVSMLPAPPQILYVPVPAATVLASASPTPAPIVTPDRTAATRTAVPAPSPLAIAPDAATTERATERAWLDAARTALGRGDFDAAMQALETARVRFPTGTLSEEREAIGVHVLLGRGDASGARLAADVFKKRHGGSLFLPAIEDAMRELESPR